MNMSEAYEKAVDKLKIQGKLTQEQLAHLNEIYGRIPTNAWRDLGNRPYATTIKELTEIVERTPPKKRQDTTHILSKYQAILKTDGRPILDMFKWSEIGNIKREAKYAIVFQFIKPQISEDGEYIMTTVDKRGRVLKSEQVDLTEEQNEITKYDTVGSANSSGEIVSRYQFKKIS